MKRLFMVVVGIMLATMNAQTVGAQENLLPQIAGVEVSPPSVLPIKGVSEATDGNYNFKSFEVDAFETGNYYTEFWILPAKYANNRYTTFMVYVNDNYVGSINPSVSNWQAARVNGKETLKLEKGTNVITIATLAPEFPEIETIKVALNNSEATFSSDAYNRFLEEASSSVSCNIPEQENVPMYASNAAAAGLAHYSNVPLNYTFYKTFSFTQGQEIFITSSSSAQHKIDVVYYGSNPIIFFPIVKPTSGTLIGTSSDSIIVCPGIIQPDLKSRFTYTPATSEEMQGLSYVYPSEKTLNSSIQVATAKLTIPKTGLYLVRIRHAVNGASSVADVNVNGTYYYENTPITLSYVDCPIPADGNAYATMTCCNNFGTDDPYLFIHGANSDRVVGFNDDGPRAKTSYFNLSTRDSYISQKYFMKTSGISVSNYSSSNPISRCNIIACISEYATKSVAKVRAKGSSVTGVPTLSILNKSVQITSPRNINGVITISANENIQRISLYGMEGNRIGSITGKGSTPTIPVSALNMSQPGIYIVCIETADGITSKKISVK